MQQRVNDDLVLHPFSIKIVKLQDIGHRVIIQSEVHAAETGDLIDLTFSVGISPQIVGEERAMLIRGVLRKAVLHEVDECLRYLDGEPVKEPHPVDDRTF